MKVEWKSDDDGDDIRDVLAVVQGLKDRRQVNRARLQPRIAGVPRAWFVASPACVSRAAACRRPGRVLERDVRSWLQAGRRAISRSDNMEAARLHDLARAIASFEQRLLRMKIAYTRRSL